MQTVLSWWGFGHKQSYGYAHERNREAVPPDAYEAGGNLALSYFYSCLPIKAVYLLLLNHSTSRMDLVPVTRPDSYRHSGHNSAISIANCDHQL